VAPAEPLSPELVLVCPELREQALAAAPPLPWELCGTWRADRVRPLGAGTSRARRPPRIHDAFLYVSGIAIPLVIIGIAVSLLTLVLTAFAGAR
jgi:hypothetical protein